MRFVFSRRFYILLALGFIPLSLSWNLPVLRYLVLIYDLLLIAFALLDFYSSRKSLENLSIEREFSKRFAIGDQTDVRLKIENPSQRDFYIQIKDEYPPEMSLNENREAEFLVAAKTNADFIYGLTPAKRGKYEVGKT